MQTLKSIGGVLLGIAAFVGVIIVVILVFSFGAQVAFTIQPFVNWLSSALFLINIIVLFIALLPKARGIAGLIIFITSYVYGLSTWIFGLAVTLALWGWLAVIIGLLIGGVGVVPIGMLASAFNGYWGIFWSLFFSLVLTYGTRIIGAILVNSYDNIYHGSEDSKYESDVIDIDSETQAHKRTWEEIE